MKTAVKGHHKRKKDSEGKQGNSLAVGHWGYNHSESHVCVDVCADKIGDSLRFVRITVTVKSGKGKGKRPHHYHH
ncbi:hypothetical protein EI94DRAFT_1745020 [Lactarius quietus]|nr:hypothetical protein EI94DRAFT_1745020 [Lactarius quietus]